MTDDETNALAQRLAEIANAQTGNPIEGAAVLLEASIALLIAVVPPSDIAEVYARISSEVIAGFEIYLGTKGQTRQ